MYTLIILFLHLVSLTLSSPTRRAVTNTSKAGLAWGGGDGADMSEFMSTGKVSWYENFNDTICARLYNRYYTWGPTTWIKNAPDGIDFVPMLWGDKSVPDFTASINQSIAQGNVKAVLGMNESVIHSRFCRNS